MKNIFLWYFLPPHSFPNDPCSGGTKNGTCYTQAECSQRGGTNAGSCAGGFGVCCTSTNPHFLIKRNVKSSSYTFFQSHWTAADPPPRTAPTLTATPSRPEVVPCRSAPAETTSARWFVSISWKYLRQAKNNYCLTDEAWLCKLCDRRPLLQHCLGDHPAGKVRSGKPSEKL